MGGVGPKLDGSVINRHIVEEIHARVMSTQFYVLLIAMYAAFNPRVRLVRRANYFGLVDTRVAALKLFDRIYQLHRKMEQDLFQHCVVRNREKDTAFSRMRVVACLTHEPSEMVVIDCWMDRIEDTFVARAMGANSPCWMLLLTFRLCTALLATDLRCVGMAKAA